MFLRMTYTEGAPERIQDFYQVFVSIEKTVQFVSKLIIPPHIRFGNGLLFDHFLKFAARFEKVVFAVNFALARRACGCRYGIGVIVTPLQKLR